MRFAKSALKALQVGLMTGMLLGWTQAARAEGGQAFLAWQRPPASQCPTAEALQQDVEELAGRPVFTASTQDARIRIQGAVSEDEMGAYAQLVVRSADGALLGVRELREKPGECAALRRPLALVLVMLLDSDTPGAEPESHAPRKLSLGPTLAGLSGTLPRVTAGLGAALTYDLLSRLRLEGEVDYWFPVRVETDAGRGARLEALSVTLGLCPRLTPAHLTFALFACANSMLGAVMASPLGLTHADRQGRLLAQVGISAEWSVRLSKALEMRGFLAPGVNLSRPRFFFMRDDGSVLDVHRAALFSFSFGLSLLFSPRAHK